MRIKYNFYLEVRSGITGRRRGVEQRGKEQREMERRGVEGIKGNKSREVEREGSETQLQVYNLIVTWREPASLQPRS